MSELNKEMSDTKNNTDHSLLTMGCVLLAIGVTLYSATDGLWVPLLFMVSSAVLLIKYTIGALTEAAE